MNNKKGFILSTYVYMLLVFFLLLLTTMLSVMNNTKILSNKLKEQSINTSGLSDKDFSFVLLGEGDMIIKKGEEYTEPGFKIQTSKKKDLSDIVKVIGSVDVNNPNTYKLTYSATYNGITKKLTRNVTVLDNIAANYITGLYKHRRDENNLINPKVTYNNIEYDTGIRYTGANPNNYVYFNCEDIYNSITYGSEGYDYKNACEIWRIIGVFDVDDGEGKIEKRVKLIREAFMDSEGNFIKMSFDSSAENENSGYGINQWGESTYEDGSEYEGADLMQLLNGYYIGKSVDCRYCGDLNEETCKNICNNTVVPLSSISLKMINDVKWYVGAQGWIDDALLLTMYIGERSSLNGKACDATQKHADIYMCTDTVERTTEWVGKIGLIYPSDYGYASSDKNCANDIINSNSMCVNNNWLHPSNDLYWTITPFFRYGSSSHFWYISNLEASYPYYARLIGGVRPSLYLSTNVQIIGGNGSTEPYKLSI